MKYILKNTEINNKKASEFETKSLLYLIGFRKDSSEVSLISIDCINDVTGVNENFDKLWDIQAKNHSTISPKKLGKFLFTLFDNHISDINFYEYILFVPKINDAYLLDSTISTYNVKNFESKTYSKIITGLKEETLRVNKSCDDVKVNEFLDRVLIVQDNKRLSTYIKSITKFKNKKIQSEEFYKSVFEDIRDIQTAKKNSYVEGEVLSKVEDILALNRHIYTKDIHTLIINRIVGCNIFEFQNPISFMPEMRKTNDDQAAEDLLQDCKSDLSRMFFNKNSNKEFWKISEYIITSLRTNGNKSIYDIADDVETNTPVKKTIMNNKSQLFLISLIKDGLKDDN